MVPFFILSLQSCMHLGLDVRTVVVQVAVCSMKHVVGILIQRLMCCKSGASQLTLLSQQLLDVWHASVCDRFLNQRNAPAITKTVFLSYWMLQSTKFLVKRCPINETCGQLLELMNHSGLSSHLFIHVPTMHCHQWIHNLPDCWHLCCTGFRADPSHWSWRPHGVSTQVATTLMRLIFRNC